MAAKRTVTKLVNLDDWPADITAGQTITVDGSGIPIAQSGGGGGDVVAATRPPQNLSEDAVQEIDIFADAGTMRMSFRGSETGDLAFDAGGEVLFAALEALPTIGVGNITLNSSDSYSLIYEFVGSLGGQVIELVSVTNSSLTWTGVGAGVGGGRAEVYESYSGSSADNLPTGAAWLDTDTGIPYFNYGTQADPDWRTAQGPPGNNGAAGVRGAAGATGAAGTKGDIGYGLENGVIWGLAVSGIGSSGPDNWPHYTPFFEVASGVARAQGIQSRAVGDSTPQIPLNHIILNQPADSTLPRIDLIVADQGSGWAPFGPAPEWDTLAITGVAAEVPVAPALPANCVLLATVLVPAGATDSSQCTITESRSFVASSSPDTPTPLIAPNGSRWLPKVANDGSLSGTAV